MNLLTQQIVIEAIKHVGVKEAARNSGPEIDRWLARVNRAPGAPWCAAFAWSMVDDACHALELTNRLMPCAGVHMLKMRAIQMHIWTKDPGPGFVYMIDHGVDPATGNRIGHCGIVDYLNESTLTGIEGNTNEAGSREGNCVARKTRKLSDITLGYLDPGRMFA